MSEQKSPMLAWLLCLLLLLTPLGAAAQAPIR